MFGFLYIMFISIEYVAVLDSKLSQLFSFVSFNTFFKLLLHEEFRKETAYTDKEFENFNGKTAICT